VFIFGNFQKNLFILGFNNETVLGEITNIERIFRPRGGSYNRISYTFDYNGENFNRSITKSAAGLGGIINNLDSLLTNKHYRIGQRIQILYNNDHKISYIRGELTSRIISTIIFMFLIPLIILLTISGLVSIFIEYLQKIKIMFLVCKNKMIFYTQYNNYKIKDSIINGIFDF
jgi:hypothetical protein